MSTILTSAIETLPSKSVGSAPRNPCSDRARFLDACHGQETDRPPVWLMRQAGRCLPEYRALKEKYSFLELVRTPELAATVTLQPIQRFGFDAAIIFSDILVIPEAMGQTYRFRDGGGIEMDFPLKTAADISNLSLDQVEDRLHYVARAIAMVHQDLSDRTALLGFAGSPWTLANFMLEGGSCKQPARALELLRTQPNLLFALLEKLSVAVTRFLSQQISAGVDAVQLFDTLGGLIPPPLFHAASGQWMHQIIAELGASVPVIVFSKGCRDWDSLFNLGASVIGVDSKFDLTQARDIFPPDIAIQGNLEPDYLVNLSSEEIKIATKSTLAKMSGRPGYIFNLGHGVPPNASLENIKAIVETVQNSYEQI